MCIVRDANASPLSISAREEIDALLALFARDRDIARLQAHITLGRMAARAAADSDLLATQATSDKNTECAGLHEDSAQLRWNLARRELGYAKVLQRHLTKDVIKYLLDEE